MSIFGMLWFLVLITFDFTLVQSNSNSGNPQLFIGKYPIPIKTPSPLNVDSKKVHNVTLPPIRFKVSLDARVKVINTGYAVEAKIDQHTQGATVTGGPLGNDTYIAYFARYFSSGNPSRPVGTLIDGAHGAPIEVVLYFLNSKYGSFEKAKRYRDGMAGLAFPIRISFQHNFKFDSFAKILREIRKSGSYVITTLSKAFRWVDGYSHASNACYRSYPGYLPDQLPNQKSSEVYYCLTVIEFCQKVTSISEKQYENSFKRVRDFIGVELTDTPPIHPQGATPVIQAEGLIQHFLS